MLKEDTIDIDSALIFLPGVKLFFDLDNKLISKMAGQMCMLRFDAGEHLINKGEAVQHLLLIKQGEVKVCLDDRDVLLGSGDIVGEMALLSGKPGKADVIAKTDAEVLALSRDDFQALLAEHTEFARVMTELMKSRMFGQTGINRLGKYKILSQLGEGGMSIVYNALDTVLGREVAIKMLKYEIAAQPGFKERFRQEAITIAQMKHPNILHVIETIEDYMTEFIVMEKLDGYDLKYFIQHQGVFSSEQTCDIISQVAMALEHAGNQRNGGIIHRDIKLANIVLDDQGHVKLMDFGIAMIEGAVPDNYEGTLLYMAPEVLQRKPFDFRVDIYALGITAFAMLTGKPPFMSSKMDTVIAQHLDEQPPDIVAMVPEVSDGLAEFIKLALVKDPEQRISSWHEIQTLLKSGKGSSVDLLDNTDMDMAVVIKLKTSGVDTDLLVKEIHQVLKVHHANYEVETIDRENPDLDFTL
jgi:serine/threonine protein kinase